VGVGPAIQMRKRRLTRGQKNIEWIEQYCRVPEGPDVGQKVKLRTWQKREIRRIYDNKHGTRRAIISFGRKNAKSSLAAMLLLLHLIGLEHRRNSQLFSSAQSQRQASLIFSLATKMIRMDPDLRACVIVRDASKMLVCPEIGTEYRALSAEVKTAFGLNPVFIIHDELGQVRGPTSELYEALETATGAQENPLSIIISTQAPTDNDLLSILIDDAKAKNDPRVVLSLYTAPATAPAFDEKTIKMANPAFGDFLNKQEVMAMAEDAKRMPSREAEYRNLVLNQRVEAHDPFISKSLWQSCGGSVDEDWGDTPVYGGLDLSSVNDLTALTLIANVRGTWQVRAMFWLPEDGIAERSRRDRENYVVWSREGFIDLTPGKSIEYEYVAVQLADILRGVNIKKIAFDRWNFKNLKPWLLKAGFEEKELEEKFVEFGQGYQSMSPALRFVESLLLSGKLAHGNNPVLTMCAGSAVVTRDPAGNRKLNKVKSRKRIDGMICLAMAAGLAESTPVEQPKEFQIVII